MILLESEGCVADVNKIEFMGRGCGRRVEMISRKNGSLLAETVETFEGGFDTSQSTGSLLAESR